VRRIVIVGGPGNGKSTLARRLAEGLGLRHIELDGLFHVTDWESATTEEFRSDLVAAMDAAPDGFTTCGNYLTMSDSLHIARADTLVWLDLPRSTVVWRTAKRTIRRAVTRERLYGNEVREGWRNFTSWDPNRNIIRWAWIHHGVYREKFGPRLTSPEWSHLRVHHLTTPEQVADFLAGALAQER